MKPKEAQVLIDAITKLVDTTRIDTDVSLTTRGSHSTAYDPSAALVPLGKDEAAEVDVLLRDADIVLAAREATISMAVNRLGGLVEGLPTHRGNFLQRIDALRAIEARIDSYDRRREGETIKPEDCAHVDFATRVDVGRFKEEGWVMAKKQSKKKPRKKTRRPRGRRGAY